MAPRSLYQLPAPLLALLSLTALSDATCYVAAYGLVGKQDGWVACPGTATSPGGVETCCIPGSECGEDSLCKTPDSLNPGTNQWYQAGCTDPSYSDTVCRNHCEGYTTTFVEWLSNEQQWMCCGDGGCNGTTTDDTFSAASPQSWQVITGAVSSSTVSTKTTPVATSTPTAAPQDSTSSGTGLSVSSPSSNAVQSSVATSSTFTSRGPVKPTSLDFKPSGAGRQPTKATVSLSPAADNTASSSSASATSPSANNSSGLSTGAKAGIGVAVALAALALIAAVIAILLLRRNRRVKEIVDEKRVRASVSTGASTNTHNAPAPPPYPRPVEIGESDRREELSADSALYELPTSNRWSK